MGERLGDILPRLGIYFLGVLLVSFGIVSCVHSELGISPISSIPYVLSQLTPWTLGEMMMGFHLANTAFQYLMERRLINVRLLLQVPVAWIFSLAIDGMQALWALPEGGTAVSCALLAASIVSTALGMHLMLSADLVQNPPDGTVRLLASVHGRKVGTMKVAYDICCIVASSALALLFQGPLSAFGAATIASALLVGRCLTFFRTHLDVCARAKAAPVQA